MKIKTKLTVGASLLMLIPVVVVCAVLGWVAVDNGRQALETKAQNQMIALRNSTQKAIENYFSTVQAQIVTLSDNRMITDALNSLPNAYRLYQSSVEAAGDAGAAKLGAMRQELLAHYNGAFADEYRKQNGGGTFDAGNWLEKLSETGITLQHAYIAANPNPLGEKSKLITPDDGSLYEVMHKRFHESLKDYQERFGYADIFLVDSKTGEVIYSVAKKAEFATSLLEGPFAGTGLGQVFKQANESDDPGFIAMTDFSAYTPSYDNQAAFVASPVFNRGKRLGVLIFQLSVDRLSGIMTHDRKWAEVGLGESGESLIVGADYSLRNDSRFQIEDETGYLESLRQTGVSGEQLARVQAKHSAIGVQQLRSPATEAALAGEAGVAVYPDYRGVDVLTAYAPVKVAGLNWAVVAKMNTEEAFRSVESLKSTIAGVAIGISLLVFVLGALVGWVFTGLIVRPIQNTVDAVRDIAEGEGDLTRRLDARSKDELGELAGWFNRFLDKMQGVVGELNSVTQNLSVSAEQLSRVSEETRDGISNQQGQTEQAATATNQMAATVQEVAKNAESAANSAMQARNEATQGKGTVDESITTIHNLSATVEQAAAVIGKLEQDSVEIGGVLDVIRNIAEQTNLLALNAAIEAARAGEQGRGFAVVADEVRTLASRTQQSTQEIQEMIERLQTASKEAVKAMDETNSQARKGTEFAVRTGEVLESITSAINQISDMNTQIASAAEEQSVVAEEINRNVVGINQIGEKTANGAQQTASASEGLNSLAGQLQRIVGQFKI
ncbi:MULTISPECIES: methyl-accepting chemotaxis protein [Sedimenticola]|uniref:methyl-accepting chemotaxis protein n=1 Tax=Sedimenticola TaxID=349742 RepID=UPI00048BE985|nr:MULTISPECIES: methyl-accepting chemotaxis protein [Sedimenticola]MCW8904108.1 methyl-accepting chemotaxis protein [Sedimenticola sp.]